MPWRWTQAVDSAEIKRMFKIHSRRVLRASFGLGAPAVRTAGAFFCLRPTFLLAGNALTGYAASAASEQQPKPTEQKMEELSKAEAKRVLKLRTKAEYLEILSIEEDKGWGDKNGTRRTYTVRARLAKIESGIIEDVTATIQKHKGNLPPLGIWQLKTDRMHR